MMSASVAVEPSLGTIRNYVLLDQIGRGAYGTVYRAHAREHPEEIVALKIIEDNSSIDRLLVEPQLLSKLHHPNIVGLCDYFLWAGKVVLVMEYVAGPDLATYAGQKERFTPAEVREFVEQISRAIAHAHGNDIVHSDLKPKNILVDSSRQRPRYVVVDFGVSRIANRVQMTRYLAGTFSFMSPEQLRGRGGTQSDLWAIGAIAYSLLTGTLPFSSTDKEELRRQILYDQPVFPPDLARDDAGLERVIVHLLEKSTVDRTQSAAELVVELSGVPLREVTGNEEVSSATHPEWEESLEGEVRRRIRRIVIWSLLASLPEVIPLPLSCLGTYLIYLGQVRKRASFVVLGFVVIFGALGVAIGIGSVLVFLLGAETANGIVAASQLLALLGLPAAANFVKLRRAQRELTLLRSLRTDDRKHALDVLREYITVAPDDTNIRRRYIEGLLACGRTAEAAVEAKLVLQRDPYNLTVTLLLAHAYLELGLLERCEQVCNNYLEISSQCFEFEELRNVVVERRRKAV